MAVSFAITVVLMVTLRAMVGNRGILRGLQRR
jgi:hypothetical protein